MSASTRWSICPVGDNLHDHLFVPMSYKMDSAVHRPTPTYFMSGLLRELKRRDGSTWAGGSSFETTGFVRTSHATDVPDLQLLSLHWVYPAPNQDADVRVVPDYLDPGMSVFPTLIYPKQPRHRPAGLGRPDRVASDRPGLPVGSRTTRTC
jgi:choline dehydrogenase